MWIALSTSRSKREVSPDDGDDVGSIVKEDHGLLFPESSSNCNHANDSTLWWDRILKRNIMPMFSLADIFLSGWLYHTQSLCWDNLCDKSGGGFVENA